MRKELAIMKSPSEILQGVNSRHRPYSEHVHGIIAEDLVSLNLSKAEEATFRKELTYLYHEASCTLLEYDNVDDPDYGIVADLVDRIENYLYPSLVNGKVNRLLRECEETFLSALVVVEDALDDPVTKHQARKSSNQIRKVLGKLREWEQPRQP